MKSRYHYAQTDKLQPLYTNYTPKNTTQSSVKREQQQLQQDYYETQKVNETQNAKLYKRKILYEKQQYPLSNNFILENYNDKLTQNERQEILQYKYVYYFGQNCMNKQDTIYTDKDYNYKPVPNDHIGYRYELLDIVGQGSFGIVYKAFDYKKQQIVALKILKNSEKYFKQGKVEIEILKRIRHQIQQDESILIQILSYGSFRGHIYFTMPFLYHDIYSLLEQYNFKGLPQNIYMEISKDCIKGLQQLQYCNIISADIKPENIILKSQQNFQIQIIDFGTGCFQGQQIYQYVQSRYYRAPEVILGMYYTTQIDVWSMGCTFVELVTGQPIFEGSNEIDQFGKIVEVLGMPEDSFIEQSPRISEFFIKINGKYKLKSKHQPNIRSLDDILYQCPQKYIDLIKQMLQFDPIKRFNPRKFSWQQYFQEYNYQQDRDTQIQLPQLIIK